jgi:Cucumopine synthase C-terminal helical bundle domain
MEGALKMANATTTAKEPIHWQDVVRLIDGKLDRIWLEEPKDLRKVANGVIASGAGSGKQVFSVMVHLEAYLMIVSQDILFRFMKSSNHDSVGVEQLVVMTREFLFGTFHLFEFLEDLGLEGMHDLGNKYDAALDTVKTKDEYRDLTAPLHAYISKLHQWTHLMFPWKLGVAFPHRSVSEVKSLAEIV